METPLLEMWRAPTVADYRQVRCGGEDPNASVPRERGGGLVAGEFTAVGERAHAAAENYVLGTGTAGLVDISVGDWHTCGLSSGGAVTCWGHQGHQGFREATAPVGRSLRSVPAMTTVAGTGSTEPSLAGVLRWIRRTGPSPRSAQDPTTPVDSNRTGVSRAGERDICLWCRRRDRSQISPSAARARARSDPAVRSYAGPATSSHPLGRHQAKLWQSAAAVVTRAAFAQMAPSCVGATTSGTWPLGRLPPRLSQARQ